MVFPRYVSHLPAGGEMVLFDRSWYNRAGVERVMGFCKEGECEEFLRTVPEFEKVLVRTGPPDASMVSDDPKPGQAKRPGKSSK